MYLKERVKIADGIIVALVWTGFLIFVVMMADCAVKTIQSGF